MGPDRYTTILGAHQGDLNRKRVGFTRGEGNTLHGVVSFRATGVVGNSHIFFGMFTLRSLGEENHPF